MKAEDLMIGNWVSYDDKSIRLRSGDLTSQFYVDQFKPIPLTEENIVEHRKWNTERFGDEHFDETLGGLHLGENVVEFYIEDHITKERKYVKELSENNTLWFFGEFSERSGWQPSMHGMKHNPSDDTWKRYSIIFDLQARYNGEE